MVKSFRKYKKILLLVGGSLLMIAFMVPEAIRQIQGDPMKRVIAYFGEAPVRVRDEALAQREYQALTLFNEVLIKNGLGVQDAQHWMLLAEAARQGGYVGGATDGTDWIGEIAAAMAPAAVRQLPLQQAIELLQDPEKFTQFERQLRERMELMRQSAAGRTQLTLTEFDQSLSKARGIARMQDAYARAGRLSDTRAAQTARRLFDRAVVDALVIPGSRLADSAPAPSEEAMTAQFNAFKDINPGEGEQGFGYRFPPRVKLEWLTIDRAAVAAAVTLSPVDVRKRYEQNRATYAGEFAAEREKVENDLREERVRKAMADADRVVQAEFKRALRGAAVVEGYRELPADWATTRPKLETIASNVVEGVRAGSGVTIPLPSVTIRDAAWLTAQEVSSLPGLGRATVRLGSRELPIVSFLFRAREITGANELGVQALLPALDSPVIDEDNNRYYVTILDARPSEPPASLDEVRAAVERDLRSKSAFEEAEREARAQVVLASAAGLQSIADLFNTRAPQAEPLQVTTGVEVSRAGQLSSELDSEAFREAVLSAAALLDPTVPTDTIDPGQRTLVVAVPETLSVAVVQITKVQPVTLEDFRLAAQRQLQSLGEEEFVRAARGLATQPQPFSREALAKRLSYRERGQDGKAREESAPAAGDAPAPAPGAG